MTLRNSFAVAAGVILLGSGTSRADFTGQAQTVPTGGLSGGAYTMSLEGQGDADTVDVWGWRRGWGWGGYRGWGWGGYRNYYGWGGYRNYYGWGGYRNYYGWGGYRPYWGAYYYPRFYYGFYQPYYYYYPSYYYFTPFCSLSADAASPQALRSDFAAEPQQQQQQYQPSPYDGGPLNPVPLPNQSPQSRPAEAKTLTLQAKTTTRFAYPAYGERVEPTSFAQDRR